VDYRADIPNLRTACKLKLPHLTEGGADQAAASEKQKKKNTIHKPTTWQDNDRASAKIPTPGLDAEGAIAELLRLKRHGLWT
jgi:hypothetical protein